MLLLNTQESSQKLVANQEGRGREQFAIYGQEGSGQGKGPKVDKSLMGMERELRPDGNGGVQRIGLRWFEEKKLGKERLQRNSLQNRE